MTQTDLDTQAEDLLGEQQLDAKLPWESIDPDEPPATYKSPFASTAISAVEAGKASATSALLSPLLLERFTRLESETAAALSEEEREEQLADRAFFSDQKISIEMLESPREATGQLDSAREALSSVVSVSSDNAAFSGPACGAIFAQDDVEAPRAMLSPISVDANAGITNTTHAAHSPEEGADATREENAPQAGPLNQGEQEEAVLCQRDANPEMFTPENEETLGVSRFDEDAILQAPRLTDLEAAAAEIMPKDVSDDTATAFTPWDTMDETPAENSLEDQSGMGGSPISSEQITGEPPLPLVSHEIPADAVAEPAMAVTANHALLDSAAELAALSASFGPVEVAEPAILVTAHPEHGLASLVEAAEPFAKPQAATEVEVEVELEPELEAVVPATSTGAIWTIPLMCLGIGLIACCMVIPQGEANRRLRYEQVALAADLKQVQKQVSVNNEFLTKVMDDPTLAERLAGRQMKTIRKGQKVLDLKQASDDGDMSPFSLVNVAKPDDLPPYHAKTGTVANLCNNARSRLYLLGTAMAMVAVGLVMGFGGTPKTTTPQRSE